MEFKALISVLNKPWFMEPNEAQRYAELASAMFVSGSAPTNDSRKRYSTSIEQFADLLPMFRVDSFARVASDGVVQVIHINYPISKYDYCGDPGTQSLLTLLPAIDADESIKSVVLWLDSPGGQADGTEALAQAIKSLKKPVVAYTDSMMCSAAYWIGSAASEIWAAGGNGGWNNTIGSIGTLVQWKDDSAKLEKEGVKIHTVFATESKDKWGDMLAANKGDYSKLRRSIDGFNSSFLSAMKENRAGKFDLEKENVLTGKTYNANEALEFGLIDRIGSFSEAVQQSLNIAQHKKALNTPQNMAFEKTLVAAATAAFAVVDGGFLLQEGDLNNIEVVLALNATTAASDKATIESLRTQLASSTETINSLNASLKTSTDQLTAASAKIEELNKKAPGFQQTSKEADPPPIAAGGDDAEFLTEADKELAQRRQLLGLK